MGQQYRVVKKVTETKALAYRQTSLKLAGLVFDTYWALTLWLFRWGLSFVGDTWGKIKTCRWRTSESDKQEGKSNATFYNVLLSRGTATLWPPYQIETQVRLPYLPQLFTASPLGTGTVIFQKNPLLLFGRNPFLSQHHLPPIST